MLSWNQVKYARITITHVFFIALTLAGYLTVGVRMLCLVDSRLSSFLATQQMLMDEKTCVILITVIRVRP